MLKERINGPIGHVVDIFAIVGTMFGIATSLGVGVRATWTTVTPPAAASATATREAFVVVLPMSRPRASVTHTVCDILNRFAKHVR